MNNLERRDTIQEEAFKTYLLIAPAFERGDYEEATRLDNLYIKQITDSIFWEQKQLLENK
tara:strand:- start:9 stop:188 length:180 start_codon:yes stop_codon:yes gene_type:complete